MSPQEATYLFEIAQTKAIEKMKTIYPESLITLFLEMHNERLAYISEYYREESRD